ncbi:stage II sporulation protein M [Luteolibacter pohnpeiensis]|uniref:Stage II sporulation protein M n=2 Tax=Luteolibacter pohnpeiensis TaxID=454153 RepID=A0A934VVW2_9BACT|nr:stage II sporulation protein M [Luteolibacter pohnpeiensis]
MTPGDFEHKNSQRWLEYERLVAGLESGKPNEHADQLPRRFRELCIDLSLVESRMYGDRLHERLNGLVIRGYNVIYRGKRGGFEHAVSFVTWRFPCAVRREWRLFLLCSLVFWLPFFAMILSAKHDMSWIQSVLGPAGMASMEQMYGGKEQQIAHLRSEYGSNFMMFCFYIYNNVGIDFRIFAGGMAAGVGTLFFLLFNGVYMGAAAGYVNQVGNPESFWTFVIGHSSFELLGMIVAGMAGMRVGLAILNPGRLPRVRALVEATKRSLPLIYGAAVMTAMAAVVEGFWSAQEIPSNIKYGVGATGWVLVSAYLLLVGRNRGYEVG